MKCLYDEARMTLLRKLTANCDNDMIESKLKARMQPLTAVTTFLGSWSQKTANSTKLNCLLNAHGNDLR